MAFREELLQFLQQAIDEVVGQPELAAFGRTLDRARSDLLAPMRVAIVGKIKTGKSTLMNAFLGEEVVPMGTSEVTFNVNVFRYGPVPETVIHFRDGTQQPGRIEDLYDATARQSDKGELIRKIRHIEVAYPNELLRKFSLIDTPGLGSVYEEDARNTLDFLGIKPDEIEAWTTAAAGSADAIIYLFSKSLSEHDMTVLRQFHGRMTEMNPVNALGVLTRVDDYFPQEPAPMERGAAVGASLQRRHSVIRQTFYLLHPICGLLALGVQTLPDAELAILQRLALLSAELLEREVWDRDAEAFREDAYEQIAGFPSRAERGAIMSRLGFYGCKAAIDRLRGGESPRKLRSTLQAMSGVGRLREIIESHFGRRAFAIKSSRRLEEILAIRFQHETSAFSERACEIVERITEQCSALRVRSNALRELMVLRKHYEGTLSLTPEEEQWLLEITGEFGAHAYQRLGFAGDTAITAMKEIAERRMLHFRRQAGPASLGSGEQREVVRTLEDSFGQLLRDLSDAQALLSRDQ